MDSTRLAALVELEHALAERDGRPPIACPEGPAGLLLDVTGLAEQLAVFATLAEAEASAAALGGHGLAARDRLLDRLGPGLPARAGRGASAPGSRRR